MIKKSICITTFAISNSGLIPLSQYIEVLYPLSKELYLITGNAGCDFFKKDTRFHTYGIYHESKENIIANICNYVLAQLKLSYLLFKLRHDVDLFIFFIGGEGLILPMITIKLLKKSVILSLAGYTIRFGKSEPSKILDYLSNINLLFADHIIVYSKTLIKDWNLEKYQNKIIVAPRHFLDLNKFQSTIIYRERDNLIGYIGRLSEEKGIINFVESIPLLLSKKSDLDFVIVGDGDLRSKVEAFLLENNLLNRVRLTGWIQHEELPTYLNSLKLVVLPSYTEGLPNLMLESMACGTPVLVNPVGSIPDIVKDGETGFLMENNSPKCIGENILRALEFPNMEQVLQNARELVEANFTYESAIERYSFILENIN